MNKSTNVPVILMDCEHRSIQGVISSFGKRGIEIVALSAQRENPPPAFRSKYVDHTYFSPTVWEEEAYLKFLIDLPHRGVLLFSTDSAAQYVSKYKRQIQDAGYLVNILDYEILRKSFDKDSIYRVCKEIGVPTIKTKEVNSIEDIYSAAEEIGYPLLLKPTRLAGARFQKIDKLEDIPRAYELMNGMIHSEQFAPQESGMIVQEYIIYDFNDIYCIECYFSRDQSSKEILVIEKIRPDINYDGTVGSRIYAGKTIRSADLERLTQQVLDHFNWTGIANVDWLYSKKYDDYLLCEINPRLPGFSNFPTKIGFEMAWYYYADLTDTPREAFQFKPALYFEALRHPGDLTSNLVAVFKGHLSLWGFIKPYLKMFTGRYQVVFDVYYGADFGLTWENYKISINNLIKKPGKYYAGRLAQSKKA
ncbi:MAG: hypothetical protein H6566_18770 [Lewinellaceae bacterium]|nr:hypothetical protein [Lewinellaceae bacterium]